MKKKTNYFLLFLKFTIVIFGIILILMENGYYDNMKAENVRLTQENIRKFEEDVKANKIVDISNYKIEEEKDYSNSISRLGQAFTDSAGKIIINGAKEVVNTLKSLCW